ncbi:MULTISPECIES: 5-(carboxyamino)imidazole ribonucleotide synthase [unclassified Staphylococcus]|uniref:5-(carboxyamino)imidazole ribonucleotide synthase n=1 Tax=unclassified Staphylococcus TaxID=91994 RepID=UPI0021D1E157|nr:MULTISPECIES: 5-(carboxyamino)imidazole ribonucleotide synthase [unclassified Staphylococcus]UXR78937.1 5-(carboxyamino)imidazole ribonucleotide synthase [Staphylococcus sp. IVB6227]UXR83098.1 5-(carboxyamino)imidazole ribonucleotide synthase [Staphylococcus sp. IVB6214]
MTFDKLKIGQTIGIIGGGQLGKMMAQSAQKMGFRVVVLDPDETCPCQYVAHQFIHAAYDDMEALERLGHLSDVVTYEFENIDAQQLKALTHSYHVPQGDQAITILQDRLAEKTSLNDAGVKVVPFRHVPNVEALDDVVTSLGYPFILKTRFGGYDGKGQLLVRSHKDIDEAYELVKKQECVAEQFLTLEREVSLTATVGNNAQIVYFPLQENEHRDQILFKTIVPSRIDQTTAARQEIEKITQAIHFVGTFTVEFFIDKSGALYVNEIAPRPHNSGHYSIEACDYSQFDTHILAVTGHDLPKEIALLKPAVMMNLLGKDLDALESQFDAHPEWHVHIYGKEVRKPARKMGHMTILTDDTTKTEQAMLTLFEGRND